jgi:hypothetical protein
MEEYVNKHKVLYRKVEGKRPLGGQDVKENAILIQILKK